MEAYGRPQVSRRNTTPNVLFLNEPSARATTSTFTSPHARTAQNEAEEVAPLHVTGERPGGDGASAQVFQQSRPPPSARPVERPQSGGMRRPPPGAAMMPQIKQRPSTARESTRGLRNDTRVPLPRDSLDESPNTKQRENHEVGPEIDERLSDETNTARFQDEQYIRQLKADIIFFHQVLLRERSPSDQLRTTMGSHNHVKQMQSIRENRSHEESTAGKSLDVLHTQLLRYNYSSDPAQLCTAKTKLEGFLGEYLIETLRVFLECRDQEVDQQNEIGATSECDETGIIELKKPPGSGSIAFANGCGTSSGSLYSGSFLCALQRVERLRFQVLDLKAHRSSLEITMKKKDKTIDQLQEQVDLFKEALAKAMSKHARNPSPNEHQSSFGQPPSNEYYVNSIESPSAPELDIETQLEQAAKFNFLEKERIRMEKEIYELRSRYDAVKKEMDQSRADGQEDKVTIVKLQDELRIKNAVYSKELQETTNAFEKRKHELENAVAEVVERSRRAEESNDAEKQQLRKDKHEVEMQYRRLEDDLKAKTSLLSQTSDLLVSLSKANQQIEALASRLKSKDHDLIAKTKALDSVRCDLSRERSFSNQLQSDLEVATKQLTDLTQRLDSSLQLQKTKDELLLKTELRLSQAISEVERHNVTIHHQANQLELLEEKLSRSISVEEDEWKRRLQQEETNWNQRLATLEHALAVERQTMSSLKEQHRVALALETEKAQHAAAQCKTVATELEAANLCIAERKKQREREVQEFEVQKSQLLDQVAVLTKELEIKRTEVLQAKIAAATGGNDTNTSKDRLDELQTKLDEAVSIGDRLQKEALAREKELRRKYEIKTAEIEESCRARFEEEIETYKSSAENALSAELEIRQQLEILNEERSLLLHKLQGAGADRATPRGASSAALSEARVELQRAKMKIAALEEKMDKVGSTRVKDLDGKLAQLSTRERKVIEDQRMTKKQKQELASEKMSLQREREALEALEARVNSQIARNKEEHQLLRQVITVLASRLALQMELLSIIPPELTATSDTRGSRPRGSPSSTSVLELVQRFQRDQPERWRGMLTKWEHLQQELDDADWQLVHMKNRLEELSLENSSASLKSVPRPRTPILSAFSDAVAAGKDVVPVAEQLQSTAPPASGRSGASTSTSTPDSDEKSLVKAASRIRDEDQDTFAIALTREMKAMKDSYEAKMDELQHELHKTQKLRVESTQRLRSELDEEKKRSHQIIAQLTDKCASLEAQLDALRRDFNQTQSRQIELLHQYNHATNEQARTQTLRMLHHAVEEACREEITAREQRELDRVRKLHDYCGSSSVVVERDDKKQLL